MAERTCIGCGRKARRDGLVRVVRSPAAGRARLDPARTAPGRGAWLCPSPACFDAAVKRGAFDRALRTAVAGQETERLRGEFLTLAEVGGQEADPEERVRWSGTGRSAIED